MLMLPLQWSWAVAASVCAHEVDAKASHFAHHEHEHENTQESAQSTDINTDTDQTEAQGFGVHADCGVCHGLGAAFFAELDPAPRVWSGGLSFMPYESAVPDRTVDTLFRPPLTLVS